MIPPAERTAMLAERAAEPALAVFEAVVLRCALDSIDDHVRWLIEHIGDEHGDDPCAPLALGVLELVHAHMAITVARTDKLMGRVRDGAEP